MKFSILFVLLFLFQAVCFGEDSGQEKAGCFEMLGNITCDQVSKRQHSSEAYRMCCEPIQTKSKIIHMEGSIDLLCGDPKLGDRRACDANSKWNKPEGNSCESILDGLSCKEIDEKISYLAYTKGYQVCCEAKFKSNTKCKIASDEETVDCITKSGEVKTYKLIKSLADIIDPLLTKFLGNSREPSKEIQSPKQELKYPADEDPEVTRY